ncbi:hypothetical protein [Microbacterium sp. AR7-10]|uniref:hypothetical protein n=1 Tax=Microbacterium sp. AR7-10 TaxID=1891970 RepID=UPI000AE5EDD4|nr:hypothetical protein [Microbacterium sp. AR7-10]
MTESIDEVVLRELLGSHQISMSLYADEGPPPAVSRRPSDALWGGDEAIGWTVVKENDDVMVSHKITTATNDSVASYGLLHDQTFLAKTVLEQEHGSANDAEALLISVAQEVQADLLITEREALLGTRLLDAGNCQVSLPGDALALVALYLRSDGQFILAKVPNVTVTASSTQFHRQVAEVHLPSLTEFVNRAEGRVSAARLLTVLSRARNLFKARDRIALLTSQAATDDIANEISLTFTHSLVDMVAFHDVLARIINEFLKPPESNPPRIKWQNPRWRARVIEEFPDLEDPWSDGGHAKHLNDALRVVRNEIHDVAPVITPFRAERGAAQVGLAFHVEVGARVVTSLGALADDSRLGIRQAFADGHLMDPHLFYEFVMPWMIRSVDDVLGALLPRLQGRPPAQESSLLLCREVVDESVRAIARVHRGSRTRSFDGIAVADGTLGL